MVQVSQNMHERLMESPACIFIQHAKSYQIPCKDLKGIALHLLLHPRRFSRTGADLCRHSISFCIHNPSQKQEESRAFLLRKPATDARRGCSSWGCDGEPSVISLSPPLVSPLLSYECHIHFPFSGAWTEPPGMMVRTITCEPLIHLHV